jgi:peptide/nickel transport system substrate-binding protein
MDDPDAAVNLRMGSWCADWPSGNAVYPPLFGSKVSSRSHFDEPAVDRQIDEINGLPHCPPFASFYRLGF